MIYFLPKSNYSNNYSNTNTKGYCVLFSHKMSQPSGDSLINAIKQLFDKNNGNKILSWIFWNYAETPSQESNHCQNKCQDLLMKWDKENKTLTAIIDGEEQFSSSDQQVCMLKTTELLPTLQNTGVPNTKFKYTSV